MLANTRQTYGLIAQILHWLTAGLILTLLMLGLYMHEFPIDTPQQIDDKIWLYSLHKTLGILALLTAIIRIVWALLQPQPHALNGDRKFESLLASTIHWVLYGSIILMPVTGWLHHASLEGFAPIWWPFSQDLPFVPKSEPLAEVFATAHMLTAFLLMGALFLHVAGALKHAVIDRDQTLNRMLPWKTIEISDSVNTEAKSNTVSWLLAGGVFAFLLLGIFASQMKSEVVLEQHEQTVNVPENSWIVDHEKSSLDIEVIQNKNPVKGNFSRWQADIIFDLDAVDEARVEVRIETASLTLGGVTKDALSGNFLNALEYPQAVFISDRFSKVSEGKYQAEGELTLAGITMPLTLPFDLKIKDDRAFMESTVELQRLDYDLGRKGYTTDGIIGFAVKIIVRLEATSK